MFLKMCCRQSVKLKVRRIVPQSRGTIADSQIQRTRPGNLAKTACWIGSDLQNDENVRVVSASFTENTHWHIFYCRSDEHQLTGKSQLRDSFCTIHWCLSKGRLVSKGVRAAPWAIKLKYRGHRVLPPNIMQEFDDAHSTAWAWVHFSQLYIHYFHHSIVLLFTYTIYLALALQST